jgi:NAD(P)-dependent dehydrogenase (short-subunit alcohol dehydrogenase family)
MTAQNKRVLVIGGETALGRALAVGLAEAGADVAIASLSNDTKAEFAINSALNELWALGRKGVALAIDASDAAQLGDAVARAETELGGLDAVVVVEEAGVAIDALREALAGRALSVVQADAEPRGTLRALLERI